VYGAERVGLCAVCLIDSGDQAAKLTGSEVTVEHGTMGQAAEQFPQIASPRRVLIFDDDRVMLKLFTNFFESEMPGYTVATASSGEQGLEAFLAEPPHVVLLDVTMPGMGGLNLLKAIRRVDQNVPVIMVTAATQSEPTEALGNGAFAYLPKPFDFRYVRLLVTMAVDSRRRASGNGPSSSSTGARPTPAMGGMQHPWGSACRA
jgi:DNA-binding NtrC family response regulator